MTPSRLKNEHDLCGTLADTRQSRDRCDRPASDACVPHRPRRERDGTLTAAYPRDRGHSSIPSIRSPDERRPIDSFIPTIQRFASAQPLGKLFPHDGNV